jgi:hypothetical protein
MSARASCRLASYRTHYLVTYFTIFLNFFFAVVNEFIILYKNYQQLTSSPLCNKGVETLILLDHII